MSKSYSESCSDEQGKCFPQNKGAYHGFRNVATVPNVANIQHAVTQVPMACGMQTMPLVNKQAASALFPITNIIKCVL